jgi:flagellar biosynthesis activator protein FlaF
VSSNIARQAAGAYGKTAVETASPRQLVSASLLEAPLIRVLDSLTDKRSNLSETLLCNHRPWMVFINSVMRDNNKSPIAVRQNILNLSVFVMAETFSMMTEPKPEHWQPSIRD